MATTDIVTTNLKVNFYSSEDQFSQQGNHSSAEMHLTMFSYVSETYHNGVSWYRVWIDGCIEQGGTCSIPGDGGVRVTLLKPYSDTNYVIQMCNTDCDVWQTAGQGTNEQKSTTSFYADYQSEYLASTVMWATIGY